MKKFYDPTYESNDTLELVGRGSDDFWFACVDLKVLNDRTLSPCDKTVFSVICGHVNVQTRSCPLRVKTLAEEVGCSVRSVQESLKALVGRGVIERIERFEHGKQKASIYKIIGRHAACYRGADSAPFAEPSENRGADSAPIVESCTHRGAKNDTPSLQEPNIYDTKDYSPSERETSFPVNENFYETTVPQETIRHLEDTDCPSETTLGETGQNETRESEAPLFVCESPFGVNGTDPIAPDEVPPAMRETVDYFLLKTGRSGIEPEELSALIALEKIHTPTRVNKEISKAVERFRRKGTPLSALTLVYVYKSLQYQNSTKHVQGKSSPQRGLSEEDIPDPYEGAYL